MNIVNRDNSPMSTYRPGAGNDLFGRLVENMFQDFFAPFAPMSGQGFGSDVVSPRLNVAETDKSFEVEAELPGVAKEDVKVAIDERRVTIEAEAKRESAQQEGENMVYAERSVRRYMRSFMLPTEVDDAGAQARLENGILMLSLPKKEGAQGKRLTIQ